MRRAAANALCHLMGELGTVEDDERGGLEGQHRLRRLFDPAPDRRQARENVERPHHGDLFQGKQ